MEVKREETINENGSHAVKTVTKITEEDGWVDVDKVVKNNPDPDTKLFKGEAVNFSFETDNPKVTRPIVRIASISIIAISIVLIVIGLFIKNNVCIGIGALLLITIIMFWINSEKEIKNIEEEHYNNKMTDNQSKDDNRN